MQLYNESSLRRGITILNKLCNLLPALILSVYLIGCSAPNAQKGPTNSKRLSAADVVRDYYTDLSNQDVQDAKTFLSPAELDFQSKVVDSDFTNLASLSNLTVSKAYNIPLYDHYKYEVQVVAHYQAIYHEEVSTANGPQTGFVYLGRNDNKSPWLILSIGSGP